MFISQFIKLRAFVVGILGASLFSVVAAAEPSAGWAKVGDPLPS